MNIKCINQEVTFKTMLFPHQAIGYEEKGLPSPPAPHQNEIFNDGYFDKINFVQLMPFTVYALSE